MKLDALLTKLITKGTADGISANLLHDLLEYKNNIMNPNSHYDIEQPLFKSELKLALETLDKISNEMSIEL